MAAGGHAELAAGLVACQRQRSTGVSRRSGAASGGLGVAVRFLPRVSFAVCLRNFADFRPCLRREDAVAYCESLGARLPHEWEWQYAAQGNDGRPWPWGAIGDNDTVGYTHHNMTQLSNHNRIG